MIPTLRYESGTLYLLDQTLLPLEERMIECREVAQLCEAIVSLRVRGAPAIGCAAAFGVVMAAERLAEEGLRGEHLRSRLLDAALRLDASRPTAVNLSWAIARMRMVVQRDDAEAPQVLIEKLHAEACRVLQEDEVANRSLGRHGADIVPDGANVLTHCNAGALATGSYGTALGVMRAAREQGKRLHVWVDETRPLLQGARLTAWELQRLGIPYTLITDSMAAHFMAQGRIDLVVVGADRIAANGDTANKIGTYGVAVLANAHHLPLYVAAPTSTVDLATASGTGIPIEERQPDEVVRFRSERTAPLGAGVANPAFDVTPSQLIAGIITERGIARMPYTEDLAAMVAQSAPVPT